MLGYMLQVQGQKIRGYIAGEFADFLDRNSTYRKQNYLLLQRVSELENTLRGVQTRFKERAIDSIFVNKQSAMLNRELADCYDRIAALEKTLDDERSLVDPLKDKLVLVSQELESVKADYLAALEVTKKQASEISDLKSHTADVHSAVRHHGLAGKIREYIIRKRIERRARIEGKS